MSLLRFASEIDFDSGRTLMVVSESFVRHFYSNDDPVAQNIGIVGVVKDSRLGGVRIDDGPMMYMTAQTEPDRLNSLIVRTAAESSSVEPAVRNVIREINPRLFIGIGPLRGDVERDATSGQPGAPSS